MAANGFLVSSGVQEPALSTPTSTALGIVGDLDVRIRVAESSWSVNPHAWVYKFSESGSNRSWSLAEATVLGTPKFRLAFFDTVSGGVRFFDSTTFPSWVDGSTHWVRVTLDVDNGAGGFDGKFYTSDDTTSDPGSVSWTQLGSTITAAGVVAIKDSTQPLTILRASTATYTMFVVQVRAGIDGTVVSHLDLIHDVIDPDVVTDQQGNVWTRTQGSFVDLVEPAGMVFG